MIQSVAHMIRTPLIVLSVFGLLSSAVAQWSVSAQSKPQPLGSGAWYVEKTVTGPIDAELKVVFFDAAPCSLRVVGQPAKGSAQDLAEASRSVGAIAGCNGGFFTKEFAPLGLMIADGKRTGVFEKGPLLTGVLMVRKSKPLMLWREEFSDSSSITEFLQAGPRLVSNGVAVKGLQTGKSRSRTFVMTDSAGHWGIGLCLYSSLAELADMLASGKVITEFEVARALNLDGGSSSGLWTRDTAGKERYDSELATVRNFLMVVPRR